MAEKIDLELYIHIPFCVSKCNYCDFLSFPSDESTRERYLKALIRQIESEASLAGDGCEISSVYFGGGTPSILEAEQIKRIMAAIKEHYCLADDCEKTIEINPGTVDLCKLLEIKKIGFDRVSIGMQSADSEELKVLGRIHSYEEFEKCYVNIREAGFANVSIDVMTALPNQSKDILTATLNKVIELNPEHISAYSLIIEEGTPFYEKYGHLEEPVVGQETERELYWHCVNMLGEAGYEQYEISNFSRTGKRSRHNCGYWKRTSYQGFGLGASSLIGNKRIRNTSTLEEYFGNPLLKEEEIILSSEDELEETMFLGLRMIEGVQISRVNEMFNTDICQKYNRQIDKLLNDKLIVVDKDSIRLTHEGIDYGNYVFSMFVD